MTKIKKTLAAIIAVTTMAVGMGSLSAEAGNNSSWYVQKPYNAPSSAYQYTDSGTVTGLVNGTDYGISFIRTLYSHNDPDQSAKAKCDITNHSLKKYPTQYAYIKYNQSSSTCLFVDNWYEVNNFSTSVAYNVTAVDYDDYSFQIYGYANQFYHS